MAANADDYEPVCINDFEVLAKQNLPKFIFNQFAGGSSAEQTLQDNVAAYKR